MCLFEITYSIPQEFCTSRAFEEEFECFSKEYADLFLGSLDMKSGEEHPLEYYDAYRVYLTRFEAKISDFIENVLFLMKSTNSSILINLLFAEWLYTTGFLSPV